MSDVFTAPDGVRLRVSDEAQHADGEPTLVLVHGWSQDLRTWDRVVDVLRAGGWRGRILRHDHRGHGGSDAAPAGTATVGRAADDLAALITERVPTGPVVLAGHSMGGMSIIALAERRPELVAARVVGVGLVATTSGDMVDLDLGMPGRRGRLVARGEHVLVPLAAHLGETRAGVGRAGSTEEAPAPRRRAAAIAPVVRALVFGSRPRWSDVLSVAEQALAAHPPSVAAFRASIGEHRRTDALAALSGLPVTVLVGDHDRLCPRRHTDVIADALPSATVALFPGAGHMITVERAPEVAAHLRGLLDRAATATPRAGSEEEQREHAVPA